MTGDQVKTLEGLQKALKMEEDGKKFYLTASRQARNEPGKKLFQTLAAEEDIHARVFTDIYHSMAEQQKWPPTSFKPDGGKHLRTVFAQELSNSASAAVKGTDSEVAAADAGLDMENKTWDYYQKLMKAASFSQERAFYEALSSQEKEHQLVLQDYAEFLKDPVAFYVNKEKPGLDGV